RPRPSQFLVDRLLSMECMMKHIRAAFVGLILVAFGWAQPVSGQTVTTGTISGVVTDPQGGVLPGTTVIATHVPTGTNYEGVTQGDGRFTLLNVRVGGPYRLMVELSGFRQTIIDNINVTL